MSERTIASVLEAVRRQALPADDREFCVALHDYVRDRVRFGFTAGFERVTPEQTLALGRGHCNAQADLLCALLRGAGFEASLRFVALDKRILRHAVPAPVLFCLPSRLFHAVTQLKLGGLRCNIDSYIFDRSGFRQQRARLQAAGGSAASGWDAARSANGAAAATRFPRPSPAISSPTTSNSPRWPKPWPAAPATTLCSASISTSGWPACRRRCAAPASAI
ncbi:Transglutaminase-like superfamily [Chromobacterium violaceum]|uniref:Transglutaminase-like superfamily n=1 Tax=Chromobacterium violaceum TaxID=536 RepID=A0A3S4LKW3_CHRVL|nr:Transglutaminase-like superfamily [Chromobacterium violaceum]